MQKQYLTRIEAAEYLTSTGYPISHKTLSKMATVGGGPVYRLFASRALYTVDDLLTWAQGRTTGPLRATGVPVGSEG